MTIKITQTCDKCKKERTLTPTNGGGSGQITANHQHGGWRPFGDKHVCPECINQFIEEMG